MDDTIFDSNAPLPPASTSARRGGWKWPIGARSGPDRPAPKASAGLDQTRELSSPPRFGEWRVQSPFLRPRTLGQPQPSSRSLLGITLSLSTTPNRVISPTTPTPFLGKTAALPRRSTMSILGAVCSPPSFSSLAHPRARRHRPQFTPTGVSQHISR